jgi:hypothetical protein
MSVEQKGMDSCLGIWETGLQSDLDIKTLKCVLNLEPPALGFLHMLSFLQKPILIKGGFGSQEQTEIPS